MGRFLGIDYGEKRIGVAYSDGEGMFAFPLEVLPNNNSLISRLKEIASQKRAEGFVVGLSKNYKQEENPIMKKIKEFKILLEESTHLPVMYESEMLSTKEASHIQGEHERIDASAAAIILQSYLDRQK